MVVDLLNVDCHRGKLRRTSHRLLDNAGTTARCERKVALAKNDERNLRTLMQPGQRPTTALQAE
jgi:hypothetical protein